MIKSMKSFVFIVLLAVVFISAVMINNSLLSKFRIDLTENQIYSLSKGSMEIVEQLEEPVNLYFFYSDKASVGMTSLRNYAARVFSLLEEYATASNGNIKLHKIDPEPFSEAEDRANSFGLTAATLGSAGDAVYFGLAGRNSFDDEQVIAFFDPGQERLLEYQISKMLHKLSAPDSTKLTIITNLPIKGGQNPMTGQFEPPWAIFTQLQQLYDVEVLSNAAVNIPEDTDVLMLVHPKSYSDALSYAVDQYVMQGKNALIFVDPIAESDMSTAMNGNASPSQLDTLLQGWGVEFEPTKVLLDARNGLEIRTEYGIERHLGYIGLDSDTLSDNDVTTSGLEIINGASFGAISKASDAKFNFSPLLKSSALGDLVSVSDYTASTDLGDIARLHSGQNKQYVLAARVSGLIRSAYDAAPPESSQAHKSKVGNGNVIVVADSDLLTDRFWGSQANFFGQTVFTPFANNGDFVTNAVENLGGSAALISVRGRGTYARPFDVVEDLAVDAEKAFRKKEQTLQAQLQETEQALAELQSQWDNNGTMLLTTQQQQTIDDYLQQKVQIRKALRDVRHQLDKDIERLGSILYVANAVVFPLILVLLLWGIMLLTKSRAKGGQV